MKLAAVLLHNVSGDTFWGYKPKTSRLFHAHTFEIDADNPERAAEVVWVLTNVETSDVLRLHYPHLSQYAAQMERYRERKNRSTSVGDVIVFYEGERPAGAFACATVGWQQLPFAPEFECDYIPDKKNESEVSASYDAHVEWAKQPGRHFGPVG